MPISCLSRVIVTFLSSLALAASPLAQVPENLVAENIPPIPQDLRAQVQPYLESRAALFQDWHPSRREMIVITRFANTPQLHYVKMPAGARRQLTFFTEPVRGASFHPGSGKFILFTQDFGGGEFFQFYRYDLADAKVTLLTDGKSRNAGPKWSKSGQWLAYTSTRRNGKDNDFYIMNPAQPNSDRLLSQVSGGGWSIQDWSESDSQLLISEYISINESHLYLMDPQSGDRKPLSPKSTDKISYGQARFAKDPRIIYLTSDKDSEFQLLCKFDGQQLTPLTAQIPWDVTEFEVSPDGRLIAFLTNENGIGKLRLLQTHTGRELPLPAIPVGVLSELRWHSNNRDLAFNISSAQSPTDAFSIELPSNTVSRWTHSETGGLNPETFAEPQLAQFKSFDNLEISAFVYRPDSARFPGKRPVLISIHGGPESQARPIFQSRNNFFINELGFALVVPNVRGSAGYGKTFLTLDNGFKREDSVKDIGAVIDWIKADPQFDPDRVAVMGGSYGGYMVLASMVHFNDKLRAGIDVVGISNFVTFLLNTQDYRRDLRRAEYGDEQDPAMRAFLEKISPANRVQNITKPLFVIQGKNDPRVPLSESEQMVKAIRNHGGAVWYLMAKDEGHGFAKKQNADFQFLATILFLKEHLLSSPL